MSNEYPIGISQNPNKALTIYVSELKVADDVSKGSSGVVKEISEKDTEAKLQTVWSCTLALPNTLNDSQTHGWSRQESVVAKITDAALGGAFNQAFGKDSKVGQVGVGGIGKTIKEGAQRFGFRQPIVNPNYWQEYTGSDPRTFMFRWDMIPSSEAEANEISSIILNLKKYSSPKLTALKLALLSPYTFDLEVMNPKIEELMKLKRLALTNVEVNYSADGSLQFHRDGMPKMLTLGLTFVELTTVTADDFESGSSSGGSGLQGKANGT